MKNCSAVLSGSGEDEIITFKCTIRNVGNPETFALRTVMVLNTHKFKGIVMNIANDPPKSPFLDTNKKYTGTIKLYAVISNYGMGWGEGQPVRVMYLNERNPEEFVRAKPYFMERLAEFEYSEPTDGDEGYDAFTAAWNHRNPGNQIDVYPPRKPRTKGIPIPKQTKKDDILSITY